MVRPCQTGQDAGRMPWRLLRSDVQYALFGRVADLAVRIPGQVDVTSPLCKMARKESCKTLVCLLQALEGSSTTVELRNEITVQGTIQHVDYRMK